MIRDSKQNMYTKISKKLKSDSLSSEDWWKTLKAFISPLTRSELPPLGLNGTIYTDDADKANILNKYFQQQTILQEQNATLPDLHPPIYHTQLSLIILTPLEVESAIKTMKVGKASGPNGLSNHFLHELNPIIADPFCSLFNQSLRQGIVPAPYKDANVCPVPKKGNQSVVSNNRPISLLNLKANFLKEQLLNTYTIISILIICYLLFNLVLFLAIQL